MKTENLELVPHVPAHLLALRESADAYEKISGRCVAEGVRDFLLAGSPDFFAELESAIEPDPWRFGFAVVRKIDNRFIGMASFTGPPDANGAAEIAYGIAPDFQGKGYATEAANALVEFALASNQVAVLRAHTLAEPNASTHVLQKCGFVRAGEAVDEGIIVWRWERSTSTS